MDACMLSIFKFLKWPLQYVRDELKPFNFKSFLLTAVTTFVLIYVRTKLCCRNLTNLLLESDSYQLILRQNYTINLLQYNGNVRCIWQFEILIIQRFNKGERC